MTNTDNPDLDIKTQEHLMEEFLSGSLSKEMVQEKLSEWPGSFYYHFLLGLIQKKEKEFEDSLSSFQKANLLKPKTPGILNNIGEMLYITNKREEAIDCFEELIQLYPNHVKGLTNLAMVYQNAGILDKSEECYRKSLSLDPDSKLTNIGFCQLLQLFGKNDEALKILKKLLADNKNDVTVKKTYAHTLFKNGKKSQALRVYEDLSKKFPEDKTVMHNQAIILKLQKKYNKALEIAFKAEKIDPIIGRVSEITKTLILEIYLLQKDIKNFNQYYLSLDSKLKSNRTIAAMITYFGSQLENVVTSSFCPDQTKHILHTNLSEYASSGDALIKNLKSDIRNKYFLWEPKNNSTIGGSQTTKNLFLYKDDSFIELLDIIKSAVKKYKETFQKSDSFLIKNWPKNTSIHGWAVFLQNKGYQNAHIHPDGWVSGVFYLQIPETKKDESCIYFTQKGYDYPILNKSKKIQEKTIKPSVGDLILFPSSQFHGTRPFNSNTERISIAFDIRPEI